MGPFSGQPDMDEARQRLLAVLAALAGFPPAQFNLGRLFATGKGTTKNLDEARRWLGEAARAGVTPAQQILDFLDQEAAK